MKVNLPLVESTPFGKIRRAFRVLAGVLVLVAVIAVLVVVLILVAVAVLILIFVLVIHISLPPIW